MQDFAATSVSRRRPALSAALLVPLLVFLGIGIFLGIGLTRDPREIPSPFIGHAVPEFALPPVQGRSLGLATADLHGEVSLVNVFASWCVACREEHPVLMEIKHAAVVPVHGLNYKDQPAAAATWLDNWGDPYLRTGADLDGRVGIDWGVYGVPETFVIDREGRIAYKHIGPVTPAVWNDKLLPLIRGLQEKSPRAR